MNISYLESIKAIKKVKRENEKADIWRSIFWNTPNPHEREVNKNENKEK